MTTLLTEAVYESWYESTLKPELAHVLYPHQFKVAKRDLKGFVQISITVEDDDELATVEDVLEELEETRFTVIS